MKTYRFIISVSEDEFLSYGITEEFSKLESDLSLEQIHENIKMLIVNNLDNILTKKIEREVLY